MSPRYSSYRYEPASPPWSQGSSPAPAYDVQPRAPVMLYRSLPIVDPTTPTSPHHGLITPPPSSTGEVNPLLCTLPTVVRYDFMSDPHTIRLSSTVAASTFPTTQPASVPACSMLFIECQVSGQVIPIHSVKSSHGITCADIFLQLHAYFSRPLPPDEWRRVPEHQRDAMKAAFRRRTAHEQYPTMRMIDYLQGQTAFKRLTLKRSSRSSTPTWVLQTSS